MAASGDFIEGFRRLMGAPPFLWQERLYRDYLCQGEIPDAPDLPTGLGKTSVMAIWYLARRAGARLPRRLVYVVGRMAAPHHARSTINEHFYT